MPSAQTGAAAWQANGIAPSTAARLLTDGRVRADHATDPLPNGDGARWTFPAFGAARSGRRKFARMDPQSLIISLMAGIALFGGGILVAMIVLERPRQAPRDCSRLVARSSIRLRPMAGADVVSTKSHAKVDASRGRTQAAARRDPGGVGAQTASGSEAAPLASPGGERK